MGLFDGKGDEPETQDAPAKQVISKPEVAGSKFMTDSEIEEWLSTEPPAEDPVCCMLMGTDGTAKSGVALDFLSHEDIKAGYKMVVLDLNGGCRPLIIKHHAKDADAFIVRNPLTFDTTETGEVEVDYKQTLNKIKATVNWISKNHAKKKIKYFVFDGVSSLLKVAEYQMRVEKNLQPDQGVSMRYWISRAKIFQDVVSITKALPIGKILISHDDFIKEPGTELSSVKAKTNQEMHTKVIMKRFDLPKSVEYRAIVEKNKWSVLTEGAEFTVLRVDKEKKEYVWNSKDLIKALSG